MIADQCFFTRSKAPMGLDRVPDEWEVKMLLNRSSRIDYIGAVSLKIDFSGSSINTQSYDKEHKAGTFNVLTAKDCIEQLRQSLLNACMIQSKL